MTVSVNPVPPLTEHTGNSSYHLRGKRQKSFSHTSRGIVIVEGKENTRDEMSSPKRHNSSKGRRIIKSAGCGRREVYKTHKAEIQFPIPPPAHSSHSPRKSRPVNARNTRKSRSATTSLFHLESRTRELNNEEGLRPPSWPEESGLKETIYGLPAYGTPTLALRERVNLLEKEKVELLFRLQSYEEELEARNEEVRMLRETVSGLEESARQMEEENRNRKVEEEESKMCDNCRLLSDELDRSRMSLDLMQQDYQKLEFAFEESEVQRSEYEKRCFFLLLDSDSDGLVQLPELATHEVLMPYAPELLEICFSNWNYQSGIRNLMCWDDFSLFFQYVEDRNSKASQNYWFNVLDIDGDGYIGPHDMKWLYDKVDKSECQGCIEFEDLLCQLLDMVRPKDMSRGFTLSELRKSKLSTGIIGILTNHNNMLLRRSTSEWSRGNRGPDLPL